MLRQLTPQPHLRQAFYNSGILQQRAVVAKLLLDSGRQRNIDPPL
jgi:hypothetical protein